MMHEAAAAGCKQLRQDEMREAMVNGASALNGVEHQARNAWTYPFGQGLAQEHLNTAPACHRQWAEQAAGSMAQQQAQTMAAQLGAH